MAEMYSAVVRAVVAEADRKAAADHPGRVNKGVALAQQLAKTAGLDYKFKSVQSWMRGDTMPPADVLLAVAHTAEISLDSQLGIGREPSDLEQQVARMEDQLEALQAQMQLMLHRETDTQNQEPIGLLSVVRDGLRAAARDLDLPWGEIPADATDDALAGILEARMMEVRGMLGLDWSSPATRTSGAIAAELNRQLDEVTRHIAERRGRRSGHQRRQVAN